MDRFEWDDRVGVWANLTGIYSEIREAIRGGYIDDSEAEEFQEYCDEHDLDPFEEETAEEFNNRGWTRRI